MFYVLNFIAAMYERADRLAKKADDRGATATEYAMLVAFIAVAITVGVGLFGDALNDFFKGLGKDIGITSGK